MKKHLHIIAGLGCVLIIVGISAGIIASRGEPPSTLPNDYQGRTYDYTSQQQEELMRQQEQRQRQEEGRRQGGLQESQQRRAEYLALYGEWLALQSQIESLQFRIQMLQIDLNGKYAEKAACIEAHAKDKLTGTWVDYSYCLGYDSAISSIHGLITLKQQEMGRLVSQANQIKLEMERLNY